MSDVNLVVVDINGASVPSAGSLTTGNVLQVSSSSSLTYAPINLSGGSNYVSGALPVANQATQVSGLSGGIQFSAGTGFGSDVSNFYYNSSTKTLTLNGSFIQNAFGQFTVNANANSQLATQSGTLTINSAGTLTVKSSASITMGIDTVATTVIGSNLLLTSQKSTGAVQIAGGTVNIGFPTTGGFGVNEVISISTSIVAPYNPQMYFYTQTVAGFNISDGYVFSIQNSQGDNSGWGLQVVAGASASGGSSGACLMNIQNADNTDLLNIVQDLTLTAVDIVPGSANSGSIGTSTLPFSNVCTQNLSISPTVQSTAGLSDGYFQVMVNGSLKAVPYFNLS